jgi:hypothetical protein
LLSTLRRGWAVGNSASPSCTDLGRRLIPQFSSRRRGREAHLRARLAESPFGAARGVFTGRRLIPALAGLPDARFRASGLSLPPAEARERVSPLQIAPRKLTPREKRTLKRQRPSRAGDQPDAGSNDRRPPPASASPKRAARTPLARRPPGDG